MPFAQTTRALARDRPRAAFVVAGLAAIVAAAWAVWFVRAQVTVYETSDAARLEADLAAHRVDAPVGGRVTKTNLVLGSVVTAGEVLVELDAETEQRRLTEERTRLDVLGPEIDAVGRVLRAREQALQDDRQASLAAIDEGRAREQEAEIGARLLRDELDRAVRLHDGGVIPEVELNRIRADAQRRAVETQALALDVVREGREQRTRDSKATADVEDLRRELASLEGRRATTRATIDELTAEIEKRTIRASIGGRLDDVLPLTAGAYVQEGTKLASVVPRGDLRVVAELAPFTAVGRVHAGQEARLRLDGFLWTQYGEVPARVVSAASEVRDGHVRVELELLPSPGSRIPLQHGMTGSCEIAVERVTPAVLVLRSVGKLLARSP